MIRASADPVLDPWARKAASASTIVPISRFLDPHIFALKTGGYGCLFSLVGIDEEAYTDQELEAHLRTLEGTLRGMPERATLYQYTRIRNGYELPHQEHYAHPATRRFVADRLAHLNKTADFRRIDLHWCLIVEPAKRQNPRSKPNDQAAANSRMLVELQRSASMLEAGLGTLFGVKLEEKQEVLRFFAYLFNFQDWADEIALESDDDVDTQIAGSTVVQERDYLQIGHRYAQMFSLRSTPEHSRPCLFSGLMSLGCDTVICSTWTPQSNVALNKEVTHQENFAASHGRTGARALAAGNSVQRLGAALVEADDKTTGKFSLRVLVAEESLSKLRSTSAKVHRAIVEARSQVVEETMGNRSAFYALFPGNKRFDTYSLWLGEDHHARLSSVFAPAIGHTHSEDLGREYLNIFETRTGTPFFQDAYVAGVRVMLILGPPRTGKSVHGNQAIAMEQKYEGFTYIFDVGGSYESQVELYGGRMVRVGLQGPHVNPFSLKQTDSNIKFLFNFVRMLLTGSGAVLTATNEETVFKAVRDIYYLPAELRRLSNLGLPIDLMSYLSKWIGEGVYGAIFDNEEDELELSRVQCWDFQGVIEHYPDLVEPLMVWLMNRINEVIYNPANLGVPKHIVVEELFTNLRNKQMLDSLLVSIKTAGKHLGGVTMIGQSARDLGEHADSIVNACSSFLFLPDATFNREHYAKLFQLSGQQVDLFASLREREALYIRRDGLTKVIRLTLDPRSYAAFSTRPADRLRRTRLIERYGLDEGLERFATGEVL